MFQLHNKYPLLGKSKMNADVSRAYRLLRTKMNRVCQVNQKSFLITSVLKGEGKTMTAVNLGVAYALEGKRVVLVDANLTQPALHEVFSKSNRIGLSQILEQDHVLQSAIVETDIEHLMLLPAGKPMQHPSELLASKMMLDVIAQLKSSFDMILIDSSSAMKSTEPFILAGITDGVLLVVGTGKVKRHLLQQFKQHIEDVNGTIVGSVLNRATKSSWERSIMDHSQVIG
ncbi:CpsD/CapB family tyrosine-protein kinase [Paenibacillus sp. KN14-4R]|uniref:CpsD/CapB family tyrosine-protein kinase n=1 Tax=Paenibacillus sp. KN14-4R TaxID=3445773 RepID=UPI003FA08DD0